MLLRRYDIGTALFQRYVYRNREVCKFLIERLDRKRVALLFYEGDSPLEFQSIEAAETYLVLSGHEIENEAL